MHGWQLNILSSSGLEFDDNLLNDSLEEISIWFQSVVTIGLQNLTSTKFGILTLNSPRFGGYTSLVIFKV